MMTKRAWGRPMCAACRKLTAVPGSDRCASCAVPLCSVCKCRKGVNFKNCRACDLAILIAILRTRAQKQWLQLKRAIKEMIGG